MKKLMGEAGPVDPQVGYVDGYAIAERLLEGVLFRIEPSEDGSTLVCTGTPGFDRYMDKFSADQKAEWYKQAAERALTDECQNETCTEDLYWEEVD